MSRVRSKDTRPELKIRSLIHRMGYRFRKHRADLPGRPDITFAGRRKVIFVHGCFWHRHDWVLGNRTPKSRLQFWIPKLAANKARDESNRSKLVAAGWAALVLWECELRDLNRVADRIKDFLDEER